MHLLGAEALYCAGHRVNRMLECKKNAFFRAFITHECEINLYVKVIVYIFFNLIIVYMKIFIIKYELLI